MKKKLILRQCDLDFYPKVANFENDRASVVSNRLAVTASKLVHPFGLNFVHKNSGHTDTQTHTHTHTHTQIHRQTAMKI